MTSKVSSSTSKTELLRTEISKLDKTITEQFKFGNIDTTKLLISGYIENKIITNQFASCAVVKQIASLSNEGTATFLTHIFVKRKAEHENFATEIEKEIEEKDKKEKKDKFAEVRAATFSLFLREEHPGLSKARQKKLLRRECEWLKNMSALLKSASEAVTYEEENKDKIEQFYMTVNENNIMTADIKKAACDNQMGILELLLPIIEMMGAKRAAFAEKLECCTVPPATENDLIAVDRYIHHIMGRYETIKGQLANQNQSTKSKISEIVQKWPLQLSELMKAWQPEKPTSSSSSSTSSSSTSSSSTSSSSTSSSNASSLTFKIEKLKEAGIEFRKTVESRTCTEAVSFLGRLAQIYTDLDTIKTLLNSNKA